LFLTPLLASLPQATLAATIIVAVLSLVNVAAIRRVWAYSKVDFSAMAATILGTLFVGVQTTDGRVAEIIDFLNARDARVEVLGHVSDDV